MKLFRDGGLLGAVFTAALFILPSVRCDERSSINVALKASFPSAPYLLELLYAQPAHGTFAAEG